MAPQGTNGVSSRELVQWMAAGAGLFLAANTVYHSLKRFSFRNKVVIVTGGSRGLGLELSRQLGRKGARLAICSRTEEQLENAKRELGFSGTEVLALRVDITSKEQVDEFVQSVLSEYGKIDVVINNAGVIQVGPYNAMEIEDYRKAMDTHFWGPLYLIHAVLPHFRKQGRGRIVNVTSIGAKIAVPHLLPYTASKFALAGLSEGMNAELQKENIQITTVVPNLMRTGSPRNAIIKGDHEKEYAWFKFADSLPLTSQKASAAATSILRAVEYGESEVVLTATAKLATMVKGFAPSWVSNLLGVVNRFLPDNPSGSTESRRGFEASSRLSSGKIQSISDRAAIRHNEH